MSFFSIQCQPIKYADVCRRMINDFVPWIVDDEKDDNYLLCINCTDCHIKATLSNNDMCLEENLAAEEFAREKIRLIILRLLTKFFALPKRPWGTLLGIRPTKVVHRLIDKKWLDEKIISHLQEIYDLSPAKASLVTGVARRERKFFLANEVVKRKIAVYIGIPFCPTRCLYCSFPAYALKGRENMLNNFLEALEKEINYMAELIKKHNLLVETVYIGGGTPTTLEAGELDQLLTLLRGKLGENLAEFTVEAGRPDTINQEKLLVMYNHGVSRLSINPQTMRDSTLQLIGRKHSSQDTVRAFNLAREIGFDNINMDLIIGLPKENLDDLIYTLDFMQELSPESITCHTMALKRASRMREQKDNFLAADRHLIEEMMELVQNRLPQLELKPYYLYRQREILADLENVGYAKPGKESIYNVQMMEERQTVLGLGGGSVSKAVFLPDFKIKRIFNPKDPLTYIEKIAEINRKKEEFLTDWLTRNLE